MLDGGPDLGSGTARDARRALWRVSFDAYRSAIVNEPRGSDPLVGALLVKPHRADCSLGVIFFNNVGYLGMCGHGTIGLIASLKFAGKLEPGALKIDTPVGAVAANLGKDGRISVDNVVSYRVAHALKVEVPGIGAVVGDVAWGGNWFFLISEHGQHIDLKNVESLTDYSWRVRAAINSQGHPLVDHVELFSAAVRAAPTAATSCSARARLMIVHRAAPAPAQSWPVSRRMASSRKVRCGYRRA